MQTLLIFLTIICYVGFGSSFLFLCMKDAEDRKDDLSFFLRFSLLFLWPAWAIIGLFAKLKRD
jgi:hypothetical protein